MRSYLAMGAIGLVFVSYVLVSSFFYFYPQLLHRKKLNSDKKKKHLVVSHRGGSCENIENTLTAFEQHIGVDVFELDVHLTKDEKVVVFHDKSLKRCTGVNKLIGELNYNELPELLENTYSPPFTSNEDFESYQKSILPQSKKIPLLEEVFEKFPRFPINLDIKVNNDKLIELVNLLIKKYQREDVTVWGSFSEAVNKKIHNLNSDVNLMFSLQGVVRLLFLHLTGLLPFISFKETYFEIVMPNMILKYNKNLSFGYRCGLKLIQLAFIRKSFIGHLQKRGILVYFWTLNTDEEFELAFKYGANGIITDYPSKLIKFINYKKIID